MIKLLIHQKDITILNVCATNNCFKIYKEKTHSFEKEISKSTIVIGYFNTQ